MDLLCICLHGKNGVWCSLVQNGQNYKVQFFSPQATVQKVTTNYVLWKRISSKWLCIKMVMYFDKDNVKIKYHYIIPSAFLEEEKCSILKKILLLYKAKMLLRLIVTVQQDQDSSLRKTYTGNILGGGGGITKVQRHFKRRMTTHEPSSWIS